MRKMLLISLTFLLVCSAVMGQQALTPTTTSHVLSDYNAVPEKKTSSMNLIKTVGAPVRDKLMAEGVDFGLGHGTPVLREPGGTTHLIWFSVANWSGIEKVLNGMEAQLQKLATEEAKHT